MNATDNQQNLPAFHLSVLRDFREEHWPSMDLVADRLLEELRKDASGRFAVEDFCAPFSRSLTRLPFIGRSGTANNFERLWNRHRRYPRFARRLSAAGKNEAQFFHICDHSYAQIVHALPADRTGVFCHDLDTFRCLLHPHREPRPRWFRAMARRTLSGMQKAAVVFYTTEGVRQQILRHGLVDAHRLVKTPLGVAPEFTPDSSGDTKFERPFILHVGSCIARKRIDVLLEVFARLHREFPELELRQVGGEWTPQHLRQIESLNIAPHVRQTRGISDAELAQLYRGARLVLQTSEAEGFGLPVIEALACGAPVIASDIAVLREVGGEAALYCRAADVKAWSELAAAVLREEKSAPPMPVRIAQAARYTWREYARTIAAAYERLAMRVATPRTAIAGSSVQPRLKAAPMNGGGVGIA